MKTRDMGVIGLSAIAGFALTWMLARVAMPCIAAGTRLPPVLDRPVRIADVELTFKADKELYVAGDTPGIIVTARRLAGTTDELHGMLVAMSTPAPNPMMRMMPRPTAIWSNNFTVAFHCKDEWTGTLRMDRAVAESPTNGVFAGFTNESAKLEFVFEDWTDTSRVVAATRMDGILALLPVVKAGKAQ